jgi:hypothetical protein
VAAQRYQDPQSVTEEIKRIQRLFDEAGISADMDVEFASVAGTEAVGGNSMRPVLKNIRIRTGENSAGSGAASSAIENVALADPSNIQAVAASQLEISNDYYQTVLRQAKQSFRAAVAAAIVGLLFFLAAVGLGIVRHTIEVAIISALSGGIVELIAGLNFWLFGQTATQLDLFHVRLEQTQRFLLANSVCENLSDDSRDAARADLVKLIGTSGPVHPPERRGRRTRSNARQAEGGHGDLHAGGFEPVTPHL